ncbi:hypothetical protein F4806DRAFT_492549 [Annulohypoxylon nitens]|nr:hypothetical protein F4806DRAFT_492549 [Annulohypoxylon nitens]
MAPLIKTLPASWYCSKPLYDLEKSSSWHLLGPITKFADGKPVEYEFAGVGLVVKTVGQNFQVTRISDKRPLPQKRTSSGLLFAALSDEVPSFESFFPGLEELLARVDYTKLPYRRTISYEGNFNWKTMVDGYQECLHCSYTHPSFSALYPPTFYAVQNYGNYSQHIADPEKPNDGLFLYFFPVCTLNAYGGGMSVFRVCPTENPGVTRMEFDYFNLKEGEPFEEYFRFVRKVALEDFELCEKAQANLESGVYCQGILNPVKENGVSHYQQQVRKMVVEGYKEKMHRKEEAKVGG